MAIQLAELVSRVDANTAAFDRKMKASRKQGEQLNKTMKVLGGTLIAAFSARAVFRGLDAVLTKFKEEEDAAATLRAALVATGKAGEDAFAAISAEASRLQRITRAGDEEIQSAIATFAQLAPALNTNELVRAQTALIGIADTFTKGNLENAAQLIGKTIGSTTNALTRYGIQVDTAASAGEKLNQILAQSNTFFEVSQARATTLTGRTAQLANAWGDLQEGIGKFISQRAGLTKMLERVTNIMQDLTAALDRDSATVQRAFALTGEIAGNAFVGAFGTVLRALPDLMQAAANEMLGVIPGPIRKVLLAPGTLAQEAIIGLTVPAKAVEESFARAERAAAQLAALAGRSADIMGPPRPGTVPGVLGGGGRGGGGGAGGFRGGGIDPFVRLLQAGGAGVVPIQGAGKLPKGLQELLDKVNETSEGFFQLGQLQREMFSQEEKASQNIQRLAQAAFGAAQALVQVIRSGGGAAGIFGGILSLAGGIASAVPGGQLVGAGLLAGGGIISSLANRSDSNPLPVRIADFSDRAITKQTQALTGVLNFTLVIRQGDVEVSRIKQELINLARRRGNEIIIPAG